MWKPLIVINIAGLSHDAVSQEATPHLHQLASRGSRVAVQPPVPALTSVSQVTFSTGTRPSEHGIVANGWYFHELGQILNWQRSANLIHGEPIWETAKKVEPNVKTANLFWRYAAHGTCELKVIERPTYWADGRKSPDIYTEPGSFRDELVGHFGPFPLFRFWGPLADITSTRWIVDATIHVIQKKEFGLILTYLPHLDYDHQRFGPDSPQGLQALLDLDEQAARLIEQADRNDMRIAVVSDYAFEPVSRPIYPNRILRQAGLVAVQRAENGELLEPGYSKAFAVCDQQIAHVYINDPSVADDVKRRLEKTPGVGAVLDRSAMERHGIAHNRSGQLLAIADPGCWFAYPYWEEPEAEPDFHHCVAIHVKPGFDPSELFFRPGFAGKLHLAKRFAQKMLGLRAPFDVISGDPQMVRGSHGRIPETDRYRPVLITSWQQTATPSPLPMEQIKWTLLGD